MKRSITLLAAILLVISGCGGGKQSNTQSDGFVTVDVTKNYPKKELILQDILDVEYIPLETTDEFITQANFTGIGKDVLIFRNRNPFGDGSVFFFDKKTGKGLNKTSRKGQSGEEYFNVQGIILNEDNDEMFINSTFISKVLVYDLSWNFKRSFMQKETFFYAQMGDFDKDNFICHSMFSGTFEDASKIRNSILIVSKQDGSVIKEIIIPFKNIIQKVVVKTDANGKIINDRNIGNRALIPSRDNWLFAEPSSDTIYSYSQDHIMTPIIARTPSVQSMDPEIFLYPGVITDRYYFMQTIKKEYDFVAEKGFPRTELIYDRQENAIFECAVYNDDYTNKTPISMVFETSMSTFGNKEIAFVKILEAHELIEANEKGELKGKLKEIAAELNEEDNAVVMLAKYKK